MKPTLTLDQLISDLQIGEELFWEPILLAKPGAWSGHLVTAFWLTKVLQPRILVELGTHSGNSYSAFCQAVSNLGLPTRAFAVDTWQGDEHAGFYDETVYRELSAFNDSHFAGFSKLLRSTFDDARGYFDDGSIDLLHIDGLHSYEAVKHDFETWRSALSSKAVVIFHDTNVRERGFGVWKLWLELAEIYPSFEFHHSEGLGVLGVGQNQPEVLRRLYGLDPDSAAILRRTFAARGEVFRGRSQVLDLNDRNAVLSNELQARANHVSALEREVARVDATFREASRDNATKAELIRTLEQQLVGRDAVLADRALEIQTKIDVITNLERGLASRDVMLTDREQEIQTKAALINNLERDLVARDAILGNREEEIQQLKQAIVSNDQIISANQRKIAELDDSAATLQTRLANAADCLDKEESAASERFDLLQRELAGVQKRLGLIESSTAWKLASRVSSVFQPYPKFRLYARRLARLIWWTVTFQLFSRLRARRRLFTTRDIIANSDLFDGAWYLSQYPDIGEAGCDPALHYALYGATEHRNPGPRFDAEAYLQRYQDVANSGMNPLIHYLEYGAREGRVITGVGAQPAFDYSTWVARYDTIKDDDRAAINRHIKQLKDHPLISIVMPVYNTNPFFWRKALDSVLAQLYPHWELCVADDASSHPEIRAILDEYIRRDKRIKVVYRSKNGHISAASNSALELVTGEFVALMDHDDELPLHALYMVAVELNEYPDANIIYTDEDKIDANGVRQTPYFKPDWNIELFYSQNYFNHLTVYRASLVRIAKGFRLGYEGSQDYDLALRIVHLTSADKIRHIPHVLYHWRTLPGVQTFSIDNLPTAVQASRRALADYLAERGEDVRVTGGKLPQFNRVIRGLPNPAPSVSLIIPTRDRVSLLRGCVDGLLHHTAYDNCEIIIIDNDSCEIGTMQYLASLQKEPKVRILRSAGEFNYSALNNRAVGEAEGDLIGFINNDIEVIHPEWLQEMVTQVIQPGVGAVGAKLYYPDNTIQHAGVILGLGGVAGHSHRYFPRSDVGYFGRLQLVHDVSCVTAACMLMPKAVFEEVGGLDETNLTVAFNDVDLCLKIREAGYRIIWTPYAELYHLESASRGSDEVPEKIQRAIQEREYMKKRWGDALRHDPLYNRNLSLEYEDYRLAFPPRVEKPWRQEKHATS